MDWTLFRTRIGKMAAAGCLMVAAVPGAALLPAANAQLPPPQFVAVDSQVSVDFSGLTYNRRTLTYDTLGRVTNRSTQAVFTPLRLVIKNLTPGVTLTNANGTSGGFPFVDIPAPGNSFGPGQVVSNVLLKFRNTGNVRINFGRSVEGQRFLVRAPAPNPGALVANSLTPVSVGVQVYGGAGVGLESVELQVTPPLGTPFVATLRDNGLTGDQAAGDGIYSASVDVSTNGLVADQCFLLRATGQVAGVTATSADTRLCVTSFAVGGVGGNGVVDVDPTAGLQAVADQILVVFQEGTTEAQIQNVVDSAGGAIQVPATVVGFIPELRVHQIGFERQLTSDELARAIAAFLNELNQNFVVSADPNALLELAGEPSDSPDDSLLQPPSATATPDQYQWALDKVGAPEAWRVVKAQDRVDPVSGDPAPLTIALIDTGVVPHPDLAPPVARYKCIGTTTASAPCPDDTADPEGDTVGHGTLVAGVAAALTSNSGQGVAGGSWGARLVSIKVANNAAPTQMDVYNALVKARAEQARVVNVSLGKAVNYACSATFDPQRLADLVSNMVVIAAAGNGLTGSGILPFYPAHCAGVLSVANSTIQDRLHSTSNFGFGTTRKAAADLAAPGTDILTTSRRSGTTNPCAFPQYCSTNDDFTSRTGTSFATPLVAATAALMLTANDTLTPADVIARMRATGVPITQRNTNLAGSTFTNLPVAIGSIPRLDMCAAVLFSATTPMRFDNGGGSVPEDSAPGIVAGMVVPSCDNVTYTLLSGAATDPARGRFSLVTTAAPDRRQEIRLAGAVDFETAASFEITVRAALTRDPTQFVEQKLTVAVTNVNEPPAFNPPAAVSVPENTADVVVNLSATDPDTPPQPVTFSITGGADGARFQILAGNELRFVTAPDFENPGDADRNNVYLVEVTASDGQGGSTARTIAVTVTDVADAPPPGQPAAATDLLGDVLLGEDCCDFISVSGTVNGGVVRVSLRFAPGFNGAVASAVVSIDTDQSTGTGHPGIDSGGVTDAAVIGTDFIVSVGQNSPTASVLRYAGQPNSFNFVGTAPATFVPNGIDVDIPLALLGGDDGRLNIKATASKFLGEGGFTGILDVVPDVGTAALIVTP